MRPAHCLAAFFWEPGLLLAAQPARQLSSLLASLFPQRGLRVCPLPSPRPAPTACSSEDAWMEKLKQSHEGVLQQLVRSAVTLPVAAMAILPFWPQALEVRCREGRRVDSVGGAGHGTPAPYSGLPRSSTYMPHCPPCQPALLARCRAALRAAPGLRAGAHEERRQAAAADRGFQEVAGWVPAAAGPPPIWR